MCHSEPRIQQKGPLYSWMLLVSKWHLDFHGANISLLLASTYHSNMANPIDPDLVHQEKFVMNTCQVRKLHFIIHLFFTFLVKSNPFYLHTVFICKYSDWAGSPELNLSPAQLLHMISELIPMYPRVIQPQCIFLLVHCWHTQYWIGYYQSWNFWPYHHWNPLCVNPPPCGVHKGVTHGQLVLSPSPFPQLGRRDLFSPI